MKPKFFAKSCLTLVAISISLASFAQYDDNYVPLKVPDSIPSSLAELYKSNLKTSMEAFADKSDKSKFYRTRLIKRSEFITEEMRNKDVYYDGPLYDYLNGILQHIIEANGLSKNIRLFPTRNTVPNAVSYGEGTIFFYIGLLNVLENEDQVAFVICHELSHDFCKHFDKKVDNYYKTISDKELINAVKKGSRQQYNSYQTVDSLMRNMSLDIMFHSRETETEADTTGFKLLAKTKYNPLSCTRVMEIFDSCDRFKDDYSINYQDLFNFPDYPFKDKWMKYEIDDMWHEKEDDNEYTKSDSMKTHPDSKKRKAYLQELAERMKVSAHAPTDEVIGGYTFSQIRKISSFEMIEADFCHERYGKSLFRSLMALHHYPGNEYVKAMVVKNFYEIYAHQKKHTLGKHIAQPYVNFDEHYNQFLGFIQQLSLTDLSNLCELYYLNNLKKVKPTDDVDEAALMAKLVKGDGDASALAEEFVKQHPDSRLVPKVREEFFKPKEEPKKKSKK